MQVFSYAERPDLVARLDEVDDIFPEFIHHADVTDLHWAKLRAGFPELQVLLYDDERDRVVGRGQTIPASTRGGLPGGVDDMLERTFGDGPKAEPDVLSAMVAIVEFPEDGDYVVPGALVPVRCEGGRGTYLEPNVWMRHGV